MGSLQRIRSRLRLHHFQLISREKPHQSRSIQRPWSDHGLRLALMVLPSGHGRIACLVSGRAGQPFVLEGTDANGPAQWQELRSDVIPAEGTWVFQLATRTPNAFLLRLRTP